MSEELLSALGKVREATERGECLPALSLAEIDALQAHVMPRRLVVLNAESGSELTCASCVYMRHTGTIPRCSRDGMWFALRSLADGCTWHEPHE